MSRIFVLLTVLSVLGTSGAVNAAGVPKLSDADYDRATGIYFDRCSGCHGMLRKGATGPKITDEAMLKQDLPELEETIFEGTDAGMPGWGRTGDMT